MRIHSDTLSYNDFIAAIAYAEDQTDHGKITLSDFGYKGSRSRKGAIEFKLTGDGTFNKRRAGGNFNGYDPDKDYAASYDSWGHVFAWLFAIDANAKCWAYDGVADFLNRTSSAYPLPAAVKAPAVV